MASRQVLANEPVKRDAGGSNRTVLMAAAGIFVAGAMFSFEGLAAHRQYPLRGPASLLIGAVPAGVAVALGRDSAGLLTIASAPRSCSSRLTWTSAGTSNPTRHIFLDPAIAPHPCSPDRTGA